MVGVECVESAAWQLQRDSWLKFETSQESPAAGAAGGGRRPEFIAAPTFEKRRQGYVFKTDAKGTGYYLDSTAIKVTRVVHAIHPSAYEAARLWRSLPHPKTGFDK